MALGSILEIDVVRDALSRWFPSKLLDASGIGVSNVRIPQGSGNSSETILLDVAWNDREGSHRQALVIRLQPKVGMFRTYDLEAQYRVMKALHDHTEVPVPRPWAYEGDASVLGAPFLAMEFVSGSAPQDNPPYTVTGWVNDLDTASRARLVDNGLKALAAVHATGYSKLGLDFLDRKEWGNDIVERRITYWQKQLERATAGGSNPPPRAGLAWARSHRPTGVIKPVLVWGDARVGNMLFADYCSVAAVLDWEMQTIGTPEMDLAWWLDVPLPAGIPDPEATIRRYEALSGHTLQDLHYFEVLATAGCAALYHRTGKIMVESGLLPPDSPIKLNNPATQVLAELLGLPRPEGTQQSYMDGR